MGVGLAAGIVCSFAVGAKFRFNYEDSLDVVVGFRLSAEDETTGVDLTQHAETAYAEGVHGHLPQRRLGLDKR